MRVQFQTGCRRPASQEKSPPLHVVPNPKILCVSAFLRFHFSHQGRSKMMLCRGVAGNVRLRMHRPTMQVSTVERLGLKANVGS